MPNNNNTLMLTSVNISAPSTHRYSIIWLHGLGANGQDFKGIVPELTLTQINHIHFIFPNAPVQAVTINGGMKMPSWYDILESSLDKKVAVDDIYHSSSCIEDFIQQERDAGIKTENILLAGFSQGGVIALHTSLQFKEKLAGIIALSTYLPTIKHLNTTRTVCNQNTPIFMAHGLMDTVVPIHIAQKAYQQLQDWQYPIQWHDYPMQHSVSAQEIIDISTFINQVFECSHSS